MAHPFRGSTIFSLLSSKNLALLGRLLAFPVFFLACCPALLGQSPRIDLIDPLQGPIAGGTVVTIKGANLEGTTLTVDKIAIVPQAVSATQIRFTTPGHDNGIASLKVASTAGTSYGEFLYVPPKLSELPPGYITTVAGIGQFSGFYRQAVNAAVDPVGLTVDEKGNIYVAEPNQNRVSVIDPAGILEPFAGTGISPDGGASVRDGGPATEALINWPRGVATDPEGNVYIAEQASRVRRVDARTGIITTIAGNGTRGFSGDGGPAVLARVGNVSHIATDAQGNIFFIDFDDASGTPRIRKITTDGTISTVAGVGPPGFSGDDGPAIQAHFDFGGGAADFGGLAVDSQGNLYITDTGNMRIRRIDARTGIIRTVTGPNGPAGDGCLCNSSAITVDQMDNVYYYYNGGQAAHIAKMSPNGQTIAIYGKGTGFSEDGIPIEDVLLGALVSDLTMDHAGNVLYSDFSFRRVRRLNFTSGLLETVAGIGPHSIGESGPAIATVLKSRDGDVAILPTGDLLIGDPSNFLLRKVDLSGNISTVAGTGAALWDVRAEIPALQAFVCPVAVKTDTAGRIYLTDIENVYRIDPDGIMRRVAGRPHESAFSGDGGPALDAELCQPWDLALDKAGNLFIADTNNNRIRRVDAQTGIISTVAGSGPVNGSEHYGPNGRGAFCGDGGPALQACLNTPYGVTIDSADNLFIADYGNSRIRKVDTNGMITTFLANTNATKLIFDAAGYLYTATSMGIFRFDPSGKGTRLAGQSSSGFSGDGGPALKALLRNWGQATGIAISSEGDIFFVDSNNHRIRAIRYGAVLAPPNAQIQCTRGTPQSGPATTAFALPLETQVLDSSGHPAPGVRVEFSAPANGPSCIFANGTNFIGVVTDRTGHASATCTANAQQGAYSVTATPLTATATTQFSLTNTPPLGAVSANLILPAGGAVTSSTVESDGATQVGYAAVAVNSGAAPYATAVFSFRQNGVTVSEAGVPASPPTISARIFIDYRSPVAAVPGRTDAGMIDIDTGIAVVNYGSALASITYTLRDVRGITLSNGHGTLAAGTHFAKFIGQLKDVAPDFNLPSGFQTGIQFASLEISSDQPLSILALRMTINQRKEVLYTTTPTADLTLPPENAPIYFPQFADGGGNTTTLVLLNTSNGTETGMLQIFDNQGNSLVATPVGGVSDSTFSYTIPSGGALRFQTDGSPTITKVGWVKLTPDAGTSAPIGAGLFSYNPGNVLVSEAGIPPALPTSHARIYVDLSEGHNTGLAIANTTSIPAAISLSAFQIDGVTPAGTSRGFLQLAASGHDAKFATQIITGLPVDFTGVLDISSPTPFTALTLRSLYNERNDFLMTTFPLADATRGAPAPIVFPQIADGGGLMTQFILLSPVGAASTILSFYGEAGTPLAVGK